MKRRVVVTGMGICAPNAVGLPSFRQAMFEGKSGIRHLPELETLGFRCQVGGIPEITEDVLNDNFNKLDLRDLLSTGLIYGNIAGLEAWKHAGLPFADAENPHWDSGIIFGTSILGVDKFRESILKIDQGNVRRLGSTAVPQTMASGISAFLAGKIGCGNQVSSNSSACSTGTEAILMAFERIQNGLADRMLAGSCSDSGPYVWGGFDAMRVVPSGYNQQPEHASRPMAESAAGFVPSSGAGALVLESLDSALERNAHIHAEVLGGAANCGGQRSGGSMTASNGKAVQRCITEALRTTGLKGEHIDVINGHLTATSRDAEEVFNWSRALGRSGDDFPFINSFKDVLGHGLSASGSMECVAALLQFEAGQVIGNRNAADLHPEISQLINPSRVPVENTPAAPQIIAKASLGFGDVNTCVIFKRYD
ncbi:MAG: beta-ketoacyl-[acyl-carrier-protein] synthase family protein [Robiginitalea sp.]|uniref:beta-ketoacyl-[acyl-carrier-protein] synthase family protein n=1 Tax=Robiginitalea sp. TaxID=1902411 RepID=UPI003C72A99C